MADTSLNGNLWVKVHPLRQCRHIGPGLHNISRLHGQVMTLGLDADCPFDALDKFEQLDRHPSPYVVHLVRCTAGCQVTLAGRRLEAQPKNTFDDVIDIGEIP
ncbi:hypothetical protein D9M73_213410 [compost metagenome]